jgi:hypothetical protein
MTGQSLPKRAPRRRGLTIITTLSVVAVNRRRVGAWWLGPGWPGPTTPIGRFRATPSTGDGSVGPPGRGTDCGGQRGGDSTLGPPGPLPAGLAATIRPAGEKPGGSQESPHSRVGNGQRFPSWIVGVRGVLTRAWRFPREETGASHVPNLRRSRAESRPVGFGAGSGAFPRGLRRAAEHGAAPIGGASIPRGL